MMMTRNYLKTALLLGWMTGLILVCGQWLGGRSGMLPALGLALEAQVPRLHAIVERLVARAGLPMHASPSTSPMFIVTPQSAGGLANLFSTHPPIQERIRRLLAGTTGNP